MPTFLYKGFTSDGHRRSGQIDAADPADARRRLKSQNLAVAELTASASPATGRRQISALLKRRFDRTRFFANLSVLMNAGLGFDQAITAIREASDAASDRVLLDAVGEAIAEGGAPSAALAKLKVLDDDMLALIASGERSGRLAQVIGAVATDLKQGDLLRRDMIEAAIYPAFLLVMMCGAIGVVTFVLVPTLKPIFESSERSVPMIIGLLSMLGAAMSAPLAMAAMAALFGIILSVSLLRPALVGRGLNRLVLMLPLLGRVVGQMALTRYLQSLSLLLENAVPLPEALALSAKCTSRASTRAQLLGVRDAVVSGRRLSEAMGDVHLFPKSVVSLVSIGDEVNRLPAVLANAAEVLRSDSQRLLSRLMALMTPVITIVMGLLIGSLVISVMTALLSINELSLQ
jgi:general secretion pathway protein F